MKKATIKPIAIGVFVAAIAFAGCSSTSSSGTAPGSKSNSTDSSSESKSDGGGVSFTGSEEGTLQFDSVPCNIDNKGALMGANGEIKGNLAIGVMNGDTSASITVTTDAATTNTKTYAVEAPVGAGMKIAHFGDDWKVTFTNLKAPMAVGPGSITLNGTMNCTEVNKLPG